MRLAASTCKRSASMEMLMRDPASARGAMKRESSASSDGMSRPPSVVRSPRRSGTIQTACGRWRSAIACISSVIAISRLSGSESSPISRSISSSVIWRRSTRRCAVIPSAPAASAICAARTGSGTAPPRAFRTVATWSILTPRRKWRAASGIIPLPRIRVLIGRKLGLQLCLFPRLDREQPPAPSVLIFPDDRADREITDHARDKARQNTADQIGQEDLVQKAPQPFQHWMTKAEPAFDRHPDGIHPIGKGLGDGVEIAITGLAPEHPSAEIERPDRDEWKCQRIADDCAEKGGQDVASGDPGATCCQDEVQAEKRRERHERAAGETQRNPVRAVRQAPHALVDIVDPAPPALARRDRLAQSLPCARALAPIEDHEMARLSEPVQRNAQAADAVARYRWFRLLPGAGRMLGRLH